MMELGDWGCKVSARIRKMTRLYPLELAIYNAYPHNPTDVLVGGLREFPRIQLISPTLR